MQHLITFEEFKTLARPVSKHIDAMDVNAFIEEVETQIVIPAIGYRNYKNACAGIDVWDITFDLTFAPRIALNGGEWERPIPGIEKDVNTFDATFDKTFEPDNSDKVILKYCSGLKKAIAYLVYGRMLKADGTIITRSGGMMHRDSYSDHVGQTGGHAAKAEQYNDVLSVGEMYLADTMEYLRYHQNARINPLKPLRSRIRAIGR